MNRHRAYWSRMGVEGSGYHREKRAKLREDLKQLVEFHGLHEVTTEIRLMHEQKKEDDDIE